LRKYRDFCDFQDGSHCHLGFSKLQNFNGRSAVRIEFVSPCQILSKSVKRLQRYDDLTVFKMAAVHHFGFVKFKFLTVGSVKRPILHQCTKFCNRLRIYRDFCDFQDGGRCHLGFSKIQNYNG